MTNNPIKNGQRLWKDIFPKTHTNGQQAGEKVLNITNHQGSGNANQNHNEMSAGILEWLSPNQTDKR